ncbi:prolipoprotein diacylglyceryl transferase [Fervidobacterium nodosum]|uniref:Phosphatidylglycerol--prolipoprotein diacylglyceryl transferase n=1 Tax=Fervidobacterium nodosum (strain ATCC 35602 / DSM 5306 / Rt17-B1) TaxID=381764 RepID=LGT_FERNB|nr:prolipoprotein diacylglyceryl transferase [Fervidobacterium nodosum]A7HLH6.1 RecName: Full=Phosphatidylglycerol--prolipoprotein diacylglyceryl transferase [Fervidobacterium nodosum Rt17-B1]ABS60759.1 prolipoprotein diacylglyceryl transferase [Fervidobacterium nodosum Rt17-B1]
MSKSKRIILSVVIILAVGIGLFFFLREVFSGRLIVRDYIFQIGKFQLRWYSICIASGILVAYVLARRRLSMYPIKPEDLDEGLFWGIVAGILGARIYYVIFNWNYYSKYPSEIYKIWHGGLAIHGGIFGALLMIFIYSKIKGYFKFVHATDLFTSVLPLAQAIGRWGNFFNYEAYGRPTTLPWKMYVPPERRMPGFDIDRFFHPTFLYESLWDITIFVFLYFFVEKRKREYGETTALYLILYSLGRFWIESLRLDSLMAGHFRAAQVVSIILIFIGAAWYAYIIGKTGKRDN